MKANYFNTATELIAFVNATTITTINSITFDSSSGKYVLFYT